MGKPATAAAMADAYTRSKPLITRFQPGVYRRTSRNSRAKVSAARPEAAPVIVKPLRASHGTCPQIRRS